MQSEIKKIHKGLQEGKFTCKELIEESISKIKKSKNNSVNYLLDTLALEMASEVDEKIKRKEKLRVLEGVPFGIKDVFLLQNQHASGSAAILKNYISPYTATAIQKLLDAGAIPVVKENCDAFGHGSTSENSIFGPVKNALNESLVAGGSSGGSAVNVAKGFTAFSIGGDTGGSIRQPAGFNKVYGLKPTYGRISRYGIMAYASSTDCVGPIARSVDDIRILLNVMSGKDVKDQTTYTSESIPEHIFKDKIPTAELKVGYYKNFLESKSIDPKIKDDFYKMIAKLKEQKIDVQPLDFFDTDILVSTYYVLAMAETASNLARLDGSVYGERSAAKSLKESYALTRSENFSEETKRRIIGGNQVLSQGHSEEIYSKARIVKNNIIGKFKEDFQKVNLVLSPVTPDLPPEIGVSLNNPMKMYLSDAYTVGFSIGGLPTLTAPLVTETGIQVTAAKDNEKLILQFVKFLQEIA